MAIAVLRLLRVAHGSTSHGEQKKWSGAVLDSERKAKACTRNHLSAVADTLSLVLSDQGVSRLTQNRGFTGDSLGDDN